MGLQHIVLSLAIRFSFRTQKVEALLEHEFGDLRVRLERKITFADQSDDGKSEGKDGSGEEC